VLKLKLVWIRRMDDFKWLDTTEIQANLEEMKKNYENKFEKVSTTDDLSEIIQMHDENPQKMKNILFWEDNLKVMYHLLNHFEGKIDMIYIDPPFFSGNDYHVIIQENKKNQESLAYGDTWKNDLTLYLQMLNKRIFLIYLLLKKEGLFFLHADWHASHYIRLLLDKVFGPERFVNEIIWYYYNKYSPGKKRLPRAHDNIFVYSKSDKYTFNELRIPRKKPVKQLKRVMVNGVLKNAKDENNKVIYRIVKDKKMDDVWKIPCLQPASRHFTGYPTQKHPDLLRRIIQLGSKEGDLVADFFCGAGTTLLAAEQLNRNWIGADISNHAIYLTRKRLLEFQKKNKKQEKYSPQFELYTIFTDEKRKLINEGFFDKKLIIKKKI